MKKGFTLIELLVVVLIAGTLASIALPQFRRAVLRSRVVSLMPNLNSVRDAEENYYFMHRAYTDSMADLDVKVTDGSVGLVIRGPWNYALSQTTDGRNRLLMFMENSEYYPGNTHCEARNGDTQAAWLCAQALNGVHIGPGSAGYQAYRIEGAGGGHPQICDMNGDGMIDVGDVNLSSYIMDAILGKIPSDPMYDVNGDGKVDIGDWNMWTHSGADCMGAIFGR